MAAIPVEEGGEMRPRRPKSSFAAVGFDGCRVQQPAAEKRDADRRGNFVISAQIRVEVLLLRSPDYFFPAL
ncbi:MAG TPA: hypothetical protein VMG60_03915 [Burkholderiaceae bacterium]|nr:hypothetical protein [Burkholderiaceae bacterium]